MVLPTSPRTPGSGATRDARDEITSRGWGHVSHRPIELRQRVHIDCPSGWMTKPTGTASTSNPTLTSQSPFVCATLRPVVIPR